MASLCCNKGCGQRFDPQHNTKDSCLYHPGVPIFHDALKGWSCCKKRTTDFSEFLSIKGCTKGFHSKEKPPEPSSQEIADEQKAKAVKELIVQGPKSAEKMQRERPSSDEPRQLLPIKVSRSLEQALEKLNLSSKAEAPEGGCAGEAVAQVRAGTTCTNAACKAMYQGPESNMEVCNFHPGVPVFHEGMKYWSCCGIKTTDFSAFLEQPGCSSGTHCWKAKGDQKVVSCRQDWHQTSSQVVVTVYAKNPLPALSSVKANSTVLEVHITCEGNKIFQAELDLWGVIKTEKSFVSMVPSKVEIVLCKASPGSWARLELLQNRLHSCGKQKEATNAEELWAAQEEDSDDSLSWSEEEDEELEMETPSG
ncbi:integrin beta-1-binding protein 2 isoform X1 [Indicator indicator]|uniref:integrin beta-1-binding protein 2 isoform X1 n=1 Tax=Indicator indicator TaxID=1002788 RepID=UPI0023DEB223|nr:integrin beta-1-binding protein 2 isoform X1 [Indicator indicator]